jgi:hypothetical protein
MQQKNNYFMDSKYIDIIYKELSARMTYGLKVQVNGELFTFDEMHMGIGMLYTDYYRQPLESPDIILSGCYYGDDIKPYLYPLSSMTPKQKAELAHLTANIDGIFEQVLTEIEFYHRHHIDYRGLIEMGLAIDATGLGIYDR